MKRLIKRLIRNLVNWAYGADLGWELLTLREANHNLKMLMYDLFMRKLADGELGVKEEELDKIVIKYKDMRL